MILYGCPFCGEIPELHRWHGGGPKKTMVSCTSERCDVAPMVTGPTKRKAIERWNIRTDPQMTSAETVPFTVP